MRFIRKSVFLLFLFTTPMLATVIVSSPLNGSTVGSPVHFAATASSTTCSSGVASMGIYVNNKLEYVVSGDVLDTNLSLAVGSYSTAVQEWDRCGGASLTSVHITVTSEDSVTVSSPTNGSTVNSPVTYVATAVAPSCSQGVAAMGIYVNNQLKYVVQGAKLNTQLALAAGTQQTVVEAWDNCHGAAVTPITVDVASTTMAPVHHVFVIMLENKGYAQTFGSNSAAPYLANTLTAEGQLLTNYYGTGHNSNDNYIAMISGQAPDPANQGDCQIFQDFTSSNTVAAYGQVVGQGCVYPATVSTIANQLAAKGLTWHGYMESMTAACSHPALNTVDDTQGATSTNEYATKHNPFVYFHSLIDTSACAANDVPLTQLQQDITTVATTPNLSYIVPNLCHDGHDTPCADGEPGGLASADLFLQQWVPTIVNSPAYKQDGVLIITFDEAPDTDATACCNEQPGPNAALPGITGAGGGRVGAVVLSPFVAPGTQNATPYNHYSLLKTMEGFFAVPFLGYAQPNNVYGFGPDVFGLAP